MAFEKKVPEWKAPGSEPGDDLKNSGFQAGYKPPAAFFNWFWYGVSEALKELQGMNPADIGAVPQERTINNKALTADIKLNADDVGAFAKGAVVLAPNADMNTLTVVGMYTYSAASAATIANAPAATQGTLFVLPRLSNTAAGNRIQIVVSQNNFIYMRNMVDDAWSDWDRMYKTGDTIPITDGGTGATSAADARTKLGVPAVNHGRHVEDVCTTIADWDAATANGWYMGSSAANAPGTGWYFGRVIAHNSNYVLQEVYQFSASSDAKNIPKYIRAKKDGTWGAWVDVTVQTKVPVDAILNGAKQDLSNVTDDSIQSKVNAVFAKKVFAPYCVELTPPEDSANGGFLDFHFGGDISKDYTSRIIEDVLGELRVVAKLKVDGNLYENKVNRVYSTGNKPTPADIGAAASSHNQAASTITAGTFAGQVVANASGQAVGTSLLRNSKLVSADTNPTVNGEICWTYK
jgi:hypothetical protein